ncbi:hypothetical protein [Thalassotalea euphylliae]|uniref:Uncharacterized protein n=1 Tax=Thalassotalea euphylliae TaxID=1655234 RepID=A0A3E0U5Q7_9GAMM|nr:hypothetical protein [Thalassotalea euphylliae]REL31302.1 hypothetical protein DXX94_11590 [Thalassotalea euphylliae]
MGKKLKILVTCIVLSSVAVAVDYKSENLKQEEIITGNDLGTFDPPKTVDSFLDKIRNYLRQA